MSPNFVSSQALRKIKLFHLNSKYLRNRRQILSLMESVGTLSEGEWNSFSGMFSTEEADLMSQLLGSYSFVSEQDQGPSLIHPSAFWSCHEPTTNLAMVDANSYYCLDNNSTSQYFSHGGGYSSDISLFLQTPGNENYYLNNSIPVLMTNNNSSVSMDYCMVDEQNTGLSTKVFLDNVMEDASCLNEDISNDSLRESSGTQSEPVFLHDQNFQPKRKCEMSELDTMTDDKSNVNSSESPKKKSRVSGDVQKKKRNVQSKRNQKGVAISNDEEEKQSSSSSSSEEDSNVLQEPNGGEDSSTKASALNLNGKTRASRGSATDPQSLYARKRRERINERLRILQNLVPNGTKVDISTMLEEAVDYVKFLQLQIKLLSSDDLWMYAPIAYNGMNIGLDLKVSPSQQQ